MLKIHSKLISWKWCLSALFLVTLFVIGYWELKAISAQESQTIQQTYVNPISASYGPAYVQPQISSPENLVIIYNRVPKTGSTSFVNIGYDLCKKNHFRVLHINITGNLHVMTIENQMKFAHNVTDWDQMKPALYHGHMAFVDFSRLGISRSPVYINLIRKPLDRLVSYYYFLRYGDNFRPHLVRKKAGNKMSFDDCVAAGLADCKAEHMWLQVPFFCGHAAECWKPGSRWALEEAKRNLVRHYLVVGLTEDMESFIRVLEATIPRLFAGATNHYLTSEKSHLRVTSQKEAPSVATVSQIQKTSVWKLENEFYEFAAEQFKFAIKRMNIGLPFPDNMAERDREQTYFYEKIRPK